MNHPEIIPVGETNLQSQDAQNDSNQNSVEEYVENIFKSNVNLRTVLDGSLKQAKLLVHTVR